MQKADLLFLNQGSTMGSSHCNIREIMMEHMKVTNTTGSLEE